MVDDNMSTYRNCVVMMKKVKFLCLDSISGLITWLFPWDANWWGGRRLMIVFGNLPTPFTLWVKTMLSPSLGLPHVWRPSHIMWPGLIICSKAGRELISFWTISCLITSLLEITKISKELKKWVISINSVW